MVLGALGVAVGPSAIAQDQGPAPGTYRLVVTPESATLDVQPGTYMLVLQARQGSLTSEYVGVPGSTCPLTYQVGGPDVTLVIGGSGPLDPCTRTTTLQYQDTGQGIQFLHQSTEPEDRAAGDRALFDGREWLVAGTAPVPSVEASAPLVLPMGTWQVALGAEDFRAVRARWG